MAPIMAAWAGAPGQSSLFFSGDAVTHVVLVAWPRAIPSRRRSLGRFGRSSALGSTGLGWDRHPGQRRSGRIDAPPPNPAPQLPGRWMTPRVSSLSLVHHLGEGPPGNDRLRWPYVMGKTRSPQVAHASVTRLGLVCWESFRTHGCSSGSRPHGLGTPFASRGKSGVAEALRPREVTRPRGDDLR